MIVFVVNLYTMPIIQRIFVIQDIYITDTQQQLIIHSFVTQTTSVPLAWTIEKDNKDVAFPKNSILHSILICTKL